MVLATKHKQRADQPYRTRAQTPFGRIFSNHMRSWLEGYHGIGQDCRSHWLPNSCHRSGKAAALLGLEPAQTGRSRQGFCSLCLSVGGGSQLTPGRMVLRKKERPKPVQKNDANSSIKRESQIAQCQKTEGFYSAHFTDMIFSNSLQKTPSSAQPSQCVWLSG